MSQELEKARERGRIETIGLEHIRISLGYDEGKLSLTTSGGMELAYQIGLIVCVGLEDSDALKKQESDLLDQARALIAQNKYKTVSYRMDSGP